MSDIFSYINLIRSTFIQGFERGELYSPFPIEMPERKSFLKVIDEAFSYVESATDTSSYEAAIDYFGLKECAKHLNTTEDDIWSICSQNMFWDNFIALILCSNHSVTRIKGTFMTNYLKISAGGEDMLLGEWDGIAALYLRGSAVVGEENLIPLIKTLIGD